MKKIGIVFYCIILMLFCQYGPGAVAITEAQSTAVKDNCSSIKEDLKSLQKADSRVRIYLGGYYETILAKFITPLNVRLVENNLSNASLVENQNNFAGGKMVFANDFVNYQQELELLINIDCKKEPESFYEKLKVVREKRKTMVQDVAKMRVLISTHVKLVKDLEGSL